MRVADLVIVGAGGHGREVFTWSTAALAGDATLVAGFLDDEVTDTTLIGRLGGKLVGAVSSLQGWVGPYLIAIGDSGARRRIADVAGPHAVAWTLVHPDAGVGIDVEIGPGSQVAPGCVLTTNVRVGVHSIVNVGTIVSHDCRIGDFVTISPGCRLNGGVSIGAGAFLGTGAVVVPGIVVGDGARVGAGAVVVSDVPAGETVVGVPARSTRGR